MKLLFFRHRPLIPPDYFYLNLTCFLSKPN